jgi:hypothetical protein
MNVFWMVSLAALRHTLGDEEAGRSADPDVIAWPDFVALSDRPMILGRVARGLAAIERPEAARAKFKWAERAAQAVPLSVTDSSEESDRFIVTANLLLWANDVGMGETTTHFKARLAEMFSALPEPRQSWPTALSDIVK